MKIVHIDMDDVLCDYSGAHARIRKDFPLLDYPQSKTGFFLNLTPIQGALDAVGLLRDSDCLDVYVLTAPSTMNPQSYKEKREWIENNFDYEFTKKLIICPNKGLVKGHYLIDDNLHGKGQEDFEGEVIHFGSERYPSWGDVINKLML